MLSNSVVKVFEKLWAQFLSVLDTTVFPGPLIFKLFNNLLAAIELFVFFFVALVIFVIILRLNVVIDFPDNFFIGSFLGTDRLIVLELQEVNVWVSVFLQTSLDSSKYDLEDNLDGLSGSLLSNSFEEVTHLSVEFIN